MHHKKFEFFITISISTHLLDKQIYHFSLVQELLVCGGDIKHFTVALIIINGIHIYTFVHLYSLTVNRSEILFLIDKLNKQ